MSSQQLLDLYERTSKHSNYQILASPIRHMIPTGELVVRSRSEQERLDYMLEHVNWEGQSFADIGGNTGFFTLELICRGAKSGHYHEGNSAHSSFVQEAVRTLDWEDRVEVHDGYFAFSGEVTELDVNNCLLLNVLHHIGDDYGDSSITIEMARKSILDSLARMATLADRLIFQLGFNWKGDVSLPLFKNGTKQEQIDFVTAGTADSWTIERVGIAEQRADEIVYADQNSTNIERFDAMGEFLNRPLFLMKSKLRNA